MKSKFLWVLMLCFSIFLWLSCGEAVPPDEKQSEQEQTLAVEKKPAVKGVEAVPEEFEVDDVIFIENKGYKKDRKEPVQFTHREHEVNHKIACLECHHTYKEAEGVWRVGEPEKRCIECHDPLIKRGYAYKLQTAYHRNCRRCHRILLLLGKSEEAPFKKCGSCHGKSEE